MEKEPNVSKLLPFPFLFLSISQLILGAWFNPASAVPKSEDFDRLCAAPDPVKDLVVFMNDQAANPGALSHCWMSLRKEAQTFTGANNEIAKPESGCGIEGNDSRYDLLKVIQEAFMEYYFEVHSLMRARISSAEYSWCGVASA